MQRRKAREAALQALFQVDIGKGSVEAAVAYAIQINDLGDSAAAFCQDLVSGAIGHQGEIDATISNLAVDWSIDRLANVDRNILRIALYELMHRQDIPESVAISEAVEIAKEYGDDNSGRFVNGILGQFARNRKDDGDKSKE